jgi:hypothetical protein
MISLISFENALAIPEEDAKILNLNYTTTELCKASYNNQIIKKESYYYYIDELIQKQSEEDEKPKFYLEGKEKPIDSYYICTRLPDNHGLVWIEKENHLVDLIHFSLSCKYKFYIQKTVKSDEPTVQNIQLILSEIEDKAAKFEKTIDLLQSSTFNQKVNVHVGGGLITTYNELSLKENTCTDILQTELNNGWRIIAVCVQPDQRRPDYILGRYNPTLEVTSKNNASR